MTMLAHEQKIQDELDGQDAIGLTILLHSKSDLNNTAINIIQSTRRCEKLVIEAQKLLKHLYVESEFIIQALSDYQKQKVDFEIVNNSQEVGEEQHDKEE
jgi:hypothetical protein